MTKNSIEYEINKQRLEEIKKGDDTIKLNLERELKRNRFKAFFSFLICSLAAAVLCYFYTKIK